MSVEDKYLTNEELTTISLFHAKQKAEKKSIELVEKDLTIVKMKKEILKLQIQLLDKHTEDFTRLKDKEKSILESSKKENRKFTQSIADKYELDEKWGFDPDTGKLIV